MRYPTDKSSPTPGNIKAVNRGQALMKVWSFFFLTAFLIGCDQSLEPSSQTRVANGGIASGALDDRGEYAIVGSLHHGISFWRVTDQERLYDWKHTTTGDTSLAAADFSPASDWAITAEQNTLVLWNTQTGEAPRYWQAPGEILAAQLSQGGDIALLGLSDHTAVIFDIRRGGILHTLQHGNPVNSVALGDTNNVAVTGSDDGTAVTWDLRTGKKLAGIRHDEGVQLVAISPDGSLVLSVSKYDKAVIWQSQDGNVITEMPLSAGRLKRGLRFTSARFSADNQLLVTGQTDQTIVLWRLSELQNPISWKIGTRRLWKPSGASILDVAFTSNPAVLRALASDGFLYDLKISGK